MKLINDAKEIGEMVMQRDKLAATLDETAEQLEKAFNDTYKRKTRDVKRTSIPVVIDGFEMQIDKHNCEMTILDLFEDIVYSRQVEKIVQYLASKYSSCDDRLTASEARHELMGLPRDTYKEFYTYLEVAEAIAIDIMKVPK